MSANGRNTVFLIVQRGTDIGSRINLEQRQTTLGRNPDNEIVVAEALVSRYHAVIQCDYATGQVSVIDLGSTNGVLVNDKAIDPGMPHPLSRRDSISIGRSVFNLQIRPENYQPSPPPSREDDTDITLYLEPKKLFS